MERKVEGQDGNTDWRKSDENLRDTFKIFLEARESRSSDSQRTSFVHDGLCTNSEICKALAAELIECKEITISLLDAVRDRKVMLCFQTPEAAEEAFLHVSAFYINGTKISVRIANEEGEKIRSQSVTASRQLYRASRNGYLAVIEDLLNNGDDVYAIVEGSWTLLAAASHNGHSQVVKYLLEREGMSDIHAPT